MRGSGRVGQRSKQGQGGRDSVAACAMLRPSQDFTIKLGLFLETLQPPCLCPSLVQKAAAGRAAGKGSYGLSCLVIAPR